MVADALKGYIQLANGLTDVTKDKASAAAKSLAAQSPDALTTAAQSAVSTAVGTAATSAVRVQALAEGLLVTSRDNRALLMGIIRTEVERVVTTFGFAKESEVDAVRHKVDKLEQTVGGLADDTPATPSLRAALTPTKKPAAKKVVAKPATRKAPASKAAAPTGRTTTKATKKAPAKKKAPTKAAATRSATKAATTKAPAPEPSAPTAASVTAVSTPATPLVPPPSPSAAPPEVVDLTRSDALAPSANQASGPDGTQA